MLGSFESELGLLPKTGFVISQMVKTPIVLLSSLKQLHISSWGQFEVLSTISLL